MQSTILIFLFLSVILNVNYLCKMDMSSRFPMCFHCQINFFLSFFPGHGALMLVQPLLPSWNNAYKCLPRGIPSAADSMFSPGTRAAILQTHASHIKFVFLHLRWSSSVILVSHIPSKVFVPWPCNI